MAYGVHVVVVLLQGDITNKSSLVFQGNKGLSKNLLNSSYGSGHFFRSTRTSSPCRASGPRCHPSPRRSSRTTSWSRTTRSSSKRVLGAAPRTRTREATTRSDETVGLEFIAGLRRNASRQNKRAFSKRKKKTNRKRKVAVKKKKK